MDCPDVKIWCWKSSSLAHSPTYAWTQKIKGRFLRARGDNCYTTGRQVGEYRARLVPAGVVKVVVDSEPNDIDRISVLCFVFCTPS